MTQSTEKVKQKAIVTPLARLSYPALFKARAAEEGAEPKYSVTLIFDKEAQKTPEFLALKRAATEKAREKWPDKLPPKFKTPFRDAAEKEGSEGYEEGFVFISATSKQKPKVVDRKVDPDTGKLRVIDDPEEIKAGDYVVASIRPFHYEKKGNKGVAFGLINLQFRKLGDPLGNRTNPDDDFTPVDDDGDVSGESADDLI